MRRSPGWTSRPGAEALALSGQLSRSAAGCALRATALCCSGWGRGAELTVATLRSDRRTPSQFTKCAARTAPSPALLAAPDVPPRQAPPPRVATSWRGDKYRPRFFVWKVALTSHRGCVNARGRRSGGAPGLTRTSGQAVGVPSRDGRCGRLRRPCLACARGSARCSCPALTEHFASSRSAGIRSAARRRRRRASSITTSSVGEPARRSRQARRRVSRLAAGIDAASMARQCHLPNKKTWPVFVHQPGRCHPGRRGLPWRDIGRGEQRRWAVRAAHFVN